MGKQKPKFNPDMPFVEAQEVVESKPAFDPNKPFESVQKKSEDENEVGTKDLPQPAKVQKPLSGNLGTNKSIPEGGIDFSKEPKVDNGFMQGESTMQAPVETISNIQDPELKKTAIEKSQIKQKQIEEGPGKISSSIGSINQAFYNLPADALEAIAAGSNQVGKLTEAIGLEDRVPTEQQHAYQWAQKYKDWIAELSPTNPAYAEDLDTQFEGAIGNLASLVLSGGSGSVPKLFTEINELNKAANLFATGAKEAGKIIKTPPAIVGALQTGVSEFESAKNAGASDDEAFGSFLKNAAAGGVLESLPVTHFFQRLNTTTGGGVVNAIKNGATQGIEEMTTEVAQQVFSNVDAANTYDTTRQWYDGMVESGGIGFGLGFVLGAMGTKLRQKKEEVKTPEEKAEIQKSIDFVEEKSSALKSEQENNDKKQESFKPGDVVELSPNKNEQTNPQEETTENSTEQQVPVGEETTPEVNQSVADLNSKRAEIIGSLPIDENTGQPIINEETQKQLSDINNQINSIPSKEADSIIKEPTGIEVGLSEDTQQAIDKEINFLPQEEQDNQTTITNDNQNIERLPSQERIGQQEPVQTKPVKETSNQTTEASGVLQESGGEQKEAITQPPKEQVFNKKVSELTDASKNKKIDFGKVENSQEIQDEIEDIKLDASSLIDSVKITKQVLEKKKKLTKIQKEELDSANELISKIPEDYQDYSNDTLDFISQHGKALSKYDGYNKIAQRMSDLYDNIQSNEFAMVSTNGTTDLFGADNRNNAQTNQETSDNPPNEPPISEQKVDSSENEQNPSGIKKSLVSDDLIASVDLNKISEKDMHSLAGKIIATNEVVPEAIVNEILNKPRALQPKEVVALIYYKAVLDNKLRDAYKKKNELLESKESTGSIDAEINETERLVENFDIVAVITASQQSLAFRLRKGMLDKEYNLVTQINKYKSVNKGVIPAEVEAKFRELDKKLKEVNEQLNEAEKRAKLAEEELAINNIKESIAREKVKSNIKAASKDIANKIRKKKFHKPGIFSSATPVSVLVDAALEISASTIEAGGTIAQAVSDGWNHIKKSDWYKNLTEAKKTEAEEAFANMVSPKDFTDTKDERLRIPNSLIREAVEQGNNTIEDVTKFIKDAIKDDYPNVTDREVRDSITKYGKVANMSKDEIDTQIRKIKRIGKLISGLEDVANKKRPLRSGLQRDKLDTEERSLNKQLKELMKDLPLDAETEARQLKTSLDAVKSRLTNQIEDLNKEIETGERLAKSKSVPYDEETKVLIEERDRVKALHDEVFGKNELTDEQKLDRAIKATERAIAETNRRISEKDLEIKKSKPADSAELRAARERLSKSKAELGKLQEEAGITERRRLEQTKKAAQKRIEQLQEKLKNNDFSKRASKPLIADTELIKLQAEKLKIQEEFEKAQYKNELKNRPLLKKWGDVGLELFSSLWRGLAASLDFSAVLVQGIIPTARHPKDAFRSLGEMFKQLVSEKYQAQVMANIKAQEWYPAMKASKLAITEIDGKYNAREELFVSNWINVIWNAPANLVEKVIDKNKASDAWKKINPYDAANRAYTGYLNSMRVLRYLDGAKFIESQGKTFESNPEEYKAWADYVNNATGRGGLGPLETSAKTLSLVFFSPRKIMSGLNLFSPYTFIYFSKMPKAVRQKAIMDYASSLAILTTMAILWEAAIKGTEDDEEDWGVFWDSNSSDFLKPKIGNTRIDLFGGRQQQVVVMSRLLSGKFVDSNGASTKLGDRYGKDVNTRMDVLTKFFSNKFTPSLSFAKKILDQKKGSEINWEDESIQQVMPIWIRDVDELYKQHPTEIAIMLNALTIFGGGVQTYGKKANKDLTPEEKASKREEMKKEYLRKREEFKQKRQNNTN